MKLKWYGHSFFLFTSDSGVKIATDPFGEGIGYNVPDTLADVVTISHNHYDHNKTEVINGSPRIIKTHGIFEEKDIKIKGIMSSHGFLLGKNIIYVYTIDNLKICHLGDLGKSIEEKQLSEIGDVDVLITPIGGGGMVLNYKKAMECANRLKPKITIPMHYKTRRISKQFFALSNDKKFIKDSGAIYSNKQEIELNKNTINNYSSFLIMNYN
jgi:L-ascorbate metabolism protein UlaG (beta-lactamase superfamily)